MGAYVLRRLLAAIPIVLGIKAIVFLLFAVAAGDPAVTIVGRHATEETLAAKRKELGTDRPLAEQFWKEMTSFEFGRSLFTDRPVIDRITEGIVPSLSLAVPAFLLETLLAVALALFCAFYRGGLADRLVVFLTVAAVSVPSLAYILFGQYFLAFRWNLFPIFGYEPLPGGAVFLVMPAIIWIALNLGSEVRFYRAVTLEEMGQDYVRTAAAKGLPTRRILFRHVLKNSMIQIITRVVITIPFLILGSLLLESFFGIPGLGNLTIEAIHQNDYPVVKAFVLIGSILYVVFSIVTDVCYALVDPRVRLR